MKYLTLSIILIILNIQTSLAQTPVETHGQLQVVGNAILDEHGSPTHLRGMSFFWHQWDESYAYMNEDVIQWLAEDWKIQIVRVPIGGRAGDVCTAFGDTEITESDNCGMTGSIGMTGRDFGYEMARRAIEGAVKAGIYVLIDWHTHNMEVDKARDFFDQLSEEFGHLPNVVYQVFMEQTSTDYKNYGEGGDAWIPLKEYSMDIIGTIRSHDPDNIILVPTPHYNQYLELAAANPLTVDINGDSVTNMAYILHFYAGSHNAWVRDKAQAVLDSGLAVWTAECGRVATNFGPENTPDPEEWAIWQEWLDEYGIPWTKWSLGRKNEVSSSLMPSASTAGGWKNEDLRSEGLYNRHFFRKLACPTCPGFEIDKAEVTISEPSGSSKVMVKLLAQPDTDVIITAESNDPTQSEVIDTLVFTTDNWNETQDLTIHVVDDTLIESQKRSEIRIKILHDVSDTSYDEVFDQIVRVITLSEDKKPKKEPEEVLSENLEASDEIKIYPNPSSTEGFTMALPESLMGADLRITDVSGSIILEFLNVSDHEIFISQESLPSSGVYVLSVYQPSGMKSKKIINLK